MGRIYFLKTPEKRTIFPVTRAEAVLYQNTTVDKVLDSIKSGEWIPRIQESDIDVIINNNHKAQETT
jgi:hypothetical protein